MIKYSIHAKKIEATTRVFFDLVVSNKIIFKRVYTIYNVCNTRFYY